MKQIKYDDTTTLRLEFAPEWDAGTVVDAGVNIEVRDTNGTILLAATAATLVAKNSLASDASSGDVSVMLNAIGGEFLPVDRIRIGSTEEMREDRTVMGFNDDTNTLILDTVLDWDHASGVDVYPFFATYALDTTTVATFPKNKQLVISWEPVDVGIAPYTERAEIAEAGAFAASDFDAEFKELYPREYEDFRARLDTVREISERKLTYRLQSRGLNMNRVVDQQVLMDTLLSLTRYNMIKGNGDDWEFEIGSAKIDYNNDFEDLVSLPIWADDNQDDTKDDDEVKSFQPVFIERNM